MGLVWPGPIGVRVWPNQWVSSTKVGGPTMKNRGGLAPWRTAVALGTSERCGGDLGCREGEGLTVSRSPRWWILAEGLWWRRCQKQSRGGATGESATNVVSGACSVRRIRGGSRPYAAGRWGGLGGGWHDFRHPSQHRARPQTTLRSMVRLVQEYDSLMALDPAARWRWCTHTGQRSAREMRSVVIWGAERRLGEARGRWPGMVRVCEVLWPLAGWLARLTCSNGPVVARPFPIIQIFSKLIQMFQFWKIQNITSWTEKNPTFVGR
jgi:hypothetical protein